MSVVVQKTGTSKGSIRGDNKGTRSCLECGRKVRWRGGRGRPSGLHSKCRTRWRSAQRARQRHRRKVWVPAPRPVKDGDAPEAGRSGIVPPGRAVLVPPGSLVITPDIATPALLDAMDSLCCELETRLYQQPKKLKSEIQERLLSYPTWGDLILDLLTAPEATVVRLPDRLIPDN